MCIRDSSTGVSRDLLGVPRNFVILLVKVVKMNLFKIDFGKRTRENIQELKHIYIRRDLLLMPYHKRFELLKKSEVVSSYTKIFVVKGSCLKPVSHYATSLAATRVAATT